MLCLNDMSLNIWGLVLPYLFEDETSIVSLLNHHLNWIILEKSRLLKIEFPLISHFHEGILLIYKRSSNSFRTIEKKGIGFKYYMTTLQISYHLYLWRNFMKPKFLQLNLKTMVFSKLQPMHYGKRIYGKMVSINNSLIYALGGDVFDRPANECEKYIIQNDQWIPIPSMQNNRDEFGAATFNDRFIFCFSSSTYSSKRIIERIDTKSESEGWRIISHNCPTISSLGAFQMNEKCIILFGGFHKQCQNTCYIFDVSTNLITKSKIILSEADEFLFNAGYRINSEVLIYGNSNNLFIFNCRKFKWHLIKHNIFP